MARPKKKNTNPQQSMDQLLKRAAELFEEGLKFSYKIHGGEMIVDRKAKSITKSSIILAFQKARKMGVVKGPKALGNVFGASYLYPVFLRFGVCRGE